MSRRPPPPTEKARQALKKYRDARSNDKRRDIEKAIRHLRKTNAEITVAAVARRAGVQRKTVYKHPDLIAVIDQYRHQPRAEPATTGAENSIITALRRRLAAKDEEITQLRATLAQQKATIELLYGRLDDPTP
ncbi:DUF6262 family protein [Mycolicibacterium elephantis]|uniref:Transposase n=1 Tax=Mycolicibacterium elephantis DSM 44368 TaxID=1335622 RepID=A0A439DQ09_9MYCO|nr:DUF6262 family protein [Mycolicibacterium elephantis]MCV7224015.1 transposase [Mycolicibacterium elephantis]RWA17699.1 hypothetical protein MELE44368_25405 [Mycolicibacterium elephantis DSM 44368]